MKKLLLIPLFLIFTTTLFSQNFKHNGWIVQGGIGLFQYEKENQFQTNTYSVSSVVGKEFAVGKKTSIVTGIGAESLYGNYNNNSFKSLFINLPIQLRVYNNLEGVSSIFATIGVENKFKISEKFENVVTNVKYQGENGYHLGGIVGVGYRTKANENLDFSIGFNYTADITQAGYSNDANKISDGVNLSLGFIFYRKGEN